MMDRQARNGTQEGKWANITLIDRVQMPFAWLFHEVSGLRFMGTFKRGSYFYLRYFRNHGVEIGKNSIVFGFGGKRVRLRYDSTRQLHDTLVLVFEQFLNCEYSWLDVKGKNVVDIGANVGDSAIYFALNGAKRVLAFEPFPYSYMTMMKNVSTNRLRDKITGLNAGAGAKSGRIRVGEGASGIDSRLAGSKNGRLVQTVTLKEIVKRYGLEGAVLKSDCEGCEYGLLGSADNGTLRKFDQMIVEYHYGYVDLKDRLESAGFDVEHTIPYVAKAKGDMPGHEMLVGFLYAKKR